MKKVLSKVAIASMGIAMAATSASAVGIAVYQDNTAAIAAANAGPVYIANEGLSANGIDEGDVADVGFAGIGVVVVTTSVKNPSNINFAMDAGSSLSVPSQDDYYLGLWTDDGNGVIAAGELTAVTDTAGDAVPGDAVNGTLTFEPNDGAGLKAAAGVDLAVGSKLIIMTAQAATPDTATGGLNFDIAAGQALNTSYTLNVSEADNAATASTTLALGANQMDLCVPVAMDELIDLENVLNPARTTFENQATTDQATLGLLDLNTNACVGVSPFQGLFVAVAPVTGGSVAEFALKLSSTDQAIDTMEIDGVDTPYVDGGWSDDKVFADINNGTDYLATVTGTDAILARTFDASAVSVPETDYEVITYTADAGLWAINGGYTAVIPYIPFGISGYNGFIKVANTSTNSNGDITVMGVCTEYVDGVAVGSVTGTGVAGTSTAQSDVTVSQADMAAAIGLGDGVYHCAVTLLVDVDAVDLTAAAFQSDPVGRTMLPLYPNELEKQTYPIALP